MSKRLFGVMAAGVLAVGAAMPAVGQEMLHARPASLLIFPLYSSRVMENTLITVTNTNTSEIVCPNNVTNREGDIEAHYTYYDEDCQESDTQEDLTPADTITVLARSHNPQFEKGFLVVDARDPDTGRPVDFDFLIGSAIVTNAEFDFQWSYTPYAFEALITSGDQDSCGRFFVDENDGSDDGNNIDFDGAEYSFFPDVLLLDNFFGVGSPMGQFSNFTFDNTIFLMSTDPGDDDDRINSLGTDVNLLGWNNNEVRFSRNFHFDCHFCDSLGNITNAADSDLLAIDSDPSELVGVQTGWVRLQAEEPEDGILGVFVSTATAGDSFTAGRELQYTGTRAVQLVRSFF